MGQVFPIRPEVEGLPAGTHSDSTLAVNLTVGQLRQVIREEIRNAADRNGTFESGQATSGQGSTTKPYLSIVEAANLARVAPSTVRLYIRKGQLKGLKFGRRVLIARDDLEGFLNLNPIGVLQ